jgi:glycerophosphoryl diester phosphodiesterase
MLHPAFLGPAIAHRGLHDRAAGRIENSRAAIAAAAAAGYGIEIDLQRSADGEAMVFHDATLDRLTTARGAVRDRTAAELAALALTGGGGETIPTLADALTLAAGRAPLLIELKDQGGTLSADGVGPLEARVAALLADYPGPVAVMSFNPASMVEMRRLAPAIARGLTAGDPGVYDDEDVATQRKAALAELADWDAAGACFTSYHWRALPTPRTAALRATGTPVLCWTLRNAEDDAAARRNADNVTFEGYAATR